MKRFGLNLYALAVGLVLLAAPPSRADGGFAESAQSKAGRYDVRLSVKPSPPEAGENLFLLEISDGGKPLTGAAVSVHVDMKEMPMPADAKAEPGDDPGLYGASVNLGMKGLWTADVTVNQMAGMTMEGDGAARFLIETGKGVKALGGGKAGGLGALGKKAGWALALVLAGLALVFYRKLPHGGRAVAAGVATLLLVYVGTSAVVRKYRDPKTATVIDSTFMDMDSMKAPAGTVAVAVEKATAGPFQGKAVYTGTTLPDTEEIVSSPVMGRLVELNAYPGDEVEAGGLIGRLDSAELNAMLARAKAEHESEEAMARSAERMRTAMEHELTAMRQMEKEAESAVKVAEIEIHHAHTMKVEAENEAKSMEADAAFWKRAIERSKTLFERGAISKEELDRDVAMAETAEARLASAEAGVERAEADIPRSESELAMATARLAAARSNVGADEARLEQTQADLEAARAKAEAAGSEWDAAWVNLRVAEGAEPRPGGSMSLAEIRSIKGGVVTERVLSPGVIVEPGAPIVKVANIDFVRFQASAAESDLAGIRIGQPVTVRLPEDRDRAVEATVTAVFPARDAASRTGVVEARVKNPEKRFKPDQYVIMEIGIGEETTAAITVPTRAIEERNGEASVFVTESDGFRVRARRATVKTGARDNERTTIVSGLKEGDEVVVWGHRNLRDGDAVKVVPSLENDAAAAPSGKLGEGVEDGDRAGHKHEGATRYVCPMHPEVASDRPGRCPKCGMELEPEREKK